MVHPCWNLHIGEAFDLSAIGIVGYVLLNCQTYGQVLEKLSQYTRLFSQGVAIHHRISEGWVQCDCEIVTDVKNYLMDEPRQPIESTFAALVTATEQLEFRLRHGKRPTDAGLKKFKSENMKRDKLSRFRRLLTGFRSTFSDNRICDSTLAWLSSFPAWRFSTRFWRFSWGVNPR
jgi:Arabinose-binding domain of AraC transcription regulator, N-term